MTSKGFTIIELIISIFILSVAIVGIFGAFSIIVILTSDSADRLTAAYLAQEAVEIVRNIRDTNWLNINAGVPGVTWADGLTTIGACSAEGCEADYMTGTGISGTFSVPRPSNADYLNKDANGFYSYSTSGTYSPTKFKRKIIIIPITDVDGDSSHIIKVKVEVSWKQKASIVNSGFPDAVCGASNCIIIEETLYNWY